MTVKMDPLDGSSEQKSESPFDNVSDEGTFIIFDGFLESDSDDGDESDSPSIAHAARYGPSTRSSPQGMTPSKVLGVSSTLFNITCPFSESLPL
jgi:hypothetical protein